MNKRLATALAVASIFAAIPAVQAAPAGISLAPAPFTVSVNLTSKCSLTTAPGNLSLNYTSFQVAGASTNGSYGVTCTNGLPYTMALDAAATGIVAGLNYTLTLATASTAGTGIEQTWSMTYAIAGGQGGTCAGASCVGSEGRTLTVSY